MEQKIEVIYYNVAYLSRGNSGGKSILLFLCGVEKVQLSLVAIKKWRPWRDSNPRPTA
jgi:hypothetical protein